MTSLQNKVHKKPKKNKVKVKNSIPFPQDEENNQIEPLLASKFKNFMERSKLQNLKKRMDAYFGKNSAIQYKQHYNFVQKWQSTSRHQDEASYQFLQEDNILFAILCFCIIVLNAACLWCISIQRIFNISVERSTYFLYIPALIFKAIYIIVKFQLKFMKEDKNIELLPVLKLIYSDLFVIIYLAFKIRFQNNMENVIVIICEVITSFYLYRRAQEIYQYFRIMEFALTYEYQFKVFDLLTTLLTMAHTFALILYSASLYNPSMSWINSLGLLDASYLIKYLYSFYFACTTMLTIGYGDITPKNPIEVIVVVFIQIIGVVIFGYIINEIGHTLSSIRQERDNLEKDLQTIDKITKYYNLQKDLSNRAKTYVFNNKANSKQLNPQEQNNLLMNLNDQLRTQINQNNSLSIVKSSIFFLCHWTKQMQSNVAERLVKRLLAPNERIIQTAGKQRLYIIKRGRIDIQYDRFGISNGSRKVLKVIEVDSSQDISNNIYGYTSVISDRRVRLEALAKDFTSTYFIQKSSFIQCIQKTTNDFEYFHQIKSKIDQSQFSEECEVPSIMNIRQHYNPSVTVLVKKLRNALTKTKNIRQFCRRRDLKNFKTCMVYPSMTRMRQQFNSNGQIRTLQFFKISPNSNVDQVDQEEEVSDEIHGNTISILSQYSMCDPRNSIKYEGDKYQGRKSTIAITQPNQQVSIMFDIGKQYRNFFKRNNVTQVLQCYQKQNFQRKK